MLTFNYKKVFKEVKSKKAEIVKLKGRIVFKLEKWLENGIAAEEKYREY